MNEILDLAAFFVLWIAGMMLGAWWFAHFWLPLGYGLPRAFYWAVGGRVRWRVLGLYVLSPVVWLLIFTGVFVGLGLLWPSAYTFLQINSGLNIGFAFGTVIALGRAVLSNSGRRDLDEDFMKYIEPYLTPDGEVKHNVKARDQDDQLLAEASITGASAEDIRSMRRISDETNEIIGDYGEVLEALEKEGYWVVYPLSRLPYPKSVIRNALSEARRYTPERFAEPIEIVSQCLDRFVPDEDIPERLDTDEGIEKALEARRREHARNRRKARVER